MSKDRPSKKPGAGQPEPGTPPSGKEPADSQRPTDSMPASHGDIVDRRSGLDRREMARIMGELEDADTGLERRRGPGRRRTDFAKAAEEGEMTKEQFLFVMAIDAFKKANGKMFPTWTDVLEVIRLLGYRKTMNSELSLSSAEDWLERPDAPTGVRSKPGHPELERGRGGERRAS